jgi:hypothetical protein
MIKYQSQAFKLFVFLTISMFTAAIAICQTGTLQGNIIKNISLVSENNKNYLVIQGILQPDSLTKMTLQAADKKFLLGIPDAIVDDESIPNTFIPFEADKPLESIQIDQKQEIVEGELVYKVNLVIQARTSMKPYIIRPITSSEMKFELVGEQQMQQADVTPTETQPEPTAEPMAEPTAEPMAEPTAEPMAEPTAEPMAEPMAEPTAEPTVDTSAEMETNASVRMETQEIIQRFKKPSVMQVSILNASGFSRRAYKLSVYLGKIKKKIIEESLGLKLDIVNIANARSEKYPQSTIYFRENFLKSALFLAELIPGEQKVVPLKNQNEKIGVDIEIFLGKDYK